MADMLPSVDFGFNDLRERMALFTVRFDEFIERGRKRVLEERNAFRMNVAELEGMRDQINPTWTRRLLTIRQRHNVPATKPLQPSSQSLPRTLMPSRKKPRRRRKCTKPSTA